VTTSPDTVPPGTEPELPLPWPPVDLAQRLHALRIGTRFHAVAGTRHGIIHATYRIGPVRFWQVVNQFITDPEVMAAMPAECKRLDRARQARADARRRHRRSST
jgi:hypothetical protein